MILEHERQRVRALRNSSNQISFASDPTKTMKYRDWWTSKITNVNLTLNGKSRKTHPEIFPQFQFSGVNFWKTHSVFFQNCNFRGISWTDFWKIHRSIFCEHLSFCKIWGHNSRPITEIGLCYAPNYKINDWMSFPEIGLAHTVWVIPRIWTKLNRSQLIWVGWVFHQSV